MNTQNMLIARNRAFSNSFRHGDLEPLPKLGTMILTCIDARVDPAHILGLQLGEALVYRNSGGRVTQAFIDEVSTLALMVAEMTGAQEISMSITLLQHTKCGAQRFADPEFSAQVKRRIDVDVSHIAITDQERDLLADINRLRDAPHLPDSLRVSALLYDVENGTIREITPEKTLAELRN